MLFVPSVSSNPTQQPKSSSETHHLSGNKVSTTLPLRLTASPSGTPNPKRWATVQPPTPKPLHPPSFIQPTIPHLFKPSSPIPGLYHPNVSTSTDALPNQLQQLLHNQKLLQNQQLLQVQQPLCDQAQEDDIDTLSAKSQLQSPQVTPSSYNSFQKSFYNFPTQAPRLSEQDHTLRRIKRIQEIQSSLSSYTLSQSPFTPPSPPSKWHILDNPPQTALEKLRVVPNAKERKAMLHFGLWGGDESDTCHFCMAGMVYEGGLREFVPSDGTGEGKTSIWGERGTQTCKACTAPSAVKASKREKKSADVAFVEHANAQEQARNQQSCPPPNTSDSSLSRNLAISSSIDGKDVTRFMRNLQCSNSTWRTLDVDRAQICARCKEQKLDIIEHGRHTDFQLIEHNEFGAGNAVEGAGWCMVCVGTARWACMGCELRVCEECKRGLVMLCEFLISLSSCFVGERAIGERGVIFVVGDAVCR